MYVVNRQSHLPSICSTYSNGLDVEGESVLSLYPKCPLTVILFTISISRWFRKNEVKRYDEGQRMVRELTSNEDSIPTESQLDALTVYCRNDMVTNPTYDVLWERLQDFKNLRHVEKSLLVIEHLILYGTKKFIRLCLDKKPLLLKLSKYVYKVDGSDIGQNVRRRAKYCYDLLQNEDILNKDGIGKYRAGSIGPPPKDAVVSYDDYFRGADEQDLAQKQKFGLDIKEPVNVNGNSNTTAPSSYDQSAAETGGSKKKKKKKRKKKKEANLSTDDLEDGFSDNDDEDDNDIVKPKSSKKKKKKKMNDDDDDPFGGSDDFGDDDLKDVLSDDVIEAAVAATRAASS